MSCQPRPSIPTPPTNLPSCALPIGGSNSSILDACCNGHINAIATYSAPDGDQNNEDDDGCFQYCITDSPDLVQGCLAQKMEVYEKEQGAQMFECFNLKAGVRRTGGSAEGYASAGVRVRGGLGWGLRVLLGVGVVGTVLGGAI
ncbi:hypothetical protein EJ02DRAFT_514041 [Clathrospora elynae]|uniref:Uncharacterized protein n=1 Tax=Clathrospora elynae TaxID=706981 RepID=A0A6A5SH36_9PLEO|nr:hypothetical protein EJ02DRAFT_514041 [Clathrospora elynae]